jgi:hypothetical protein
MTNKAKSKIDVKKITKNINDDIKSMKGISKQDIEFIEMINTEKGFNFFISPLIDILEEEKKGQ